jgi:hypothetical protein
MNAKRLTLLAIFLCAFFPAPLAAQSPVSWLAPMPADNPVGVFAHLDVEDAINEYPGPANPTTEQLHAYLRGIYAQMFANPAIAGIALGEHWNSIESRAGLGSGPDVDQFDWSYVDDAFTAAHAAHKLLRLMITPGIYTPSFLLNLIPPCDGLFPGTSGTVSPDCGTVQFVGIPEKGANDVYVFPLPWNKLYQNAWKDFLEQLNARYRDREEFSAIALAGPVGASTEMILPTDNNDRSSQLSGLTVNQMWEALIENSFPDDPAYWNNDRVFINSWEQTIDMYETVFRGVALDLTPDSGDDLPEFSSTLPPHPPVLYSSDCSATIDVMSCDAKVEVITYLLDELGPNGNATQVGGLTASGMSDTTRGDIGLPGVKLLTSLRPQPPIPIRGGAEFDYPVSDPKTAAKEGCTSPGGTCSITPEEAAFNVLTVFFDGTPEGTLYGGTRGPAPLQYVDIDYTDVEYAEMNPCPPTPSTALGETSLQDLLNRASQGLFQIAHARSPIPFVSPTCK